MEALKFKITDIRLIAVYERIGYKHLHIISSRGLRGLHRFMFTTGLVYGLDSCGYVGRYCYENYADALDALISWDGIGDPPDSNWIKHKGEVEYSNNNN